VPVLRAFCISKRPFGPDRLWASKHREKSPLVSQLENKGVFFVSFSQTTETLQEIRTVRELVMEPEENESYRQMIVYQNSLVDQSRYMQVWVGLTIGTIFFSNQLVLMFMGATQVQLGLMQPARLSALAGLANMSSFRCYDIITKITSLTEVVVPAARICDLMDTRSKIEPDPENTV
jgi:ABC-type bacteriocin/lantibiotic exporter with double-glycine peptidase domain